MVSPSSFVLALILSLGVALFILLIGSRIAARGKDTPGKLASYACGEDVPAGKVVVNTEEFFVYAVYFMIFHILAFVLATTIIRPSNIFVPIVYAGVSLLSVGILALRRM